MNTCPCCSYPLMRHIRSHSIYWFCHHCWQEMPNFGECEPLTVGVSSGVDAPQVMPMVRDPWEEEISLRDNARTLGRKNAFPNAKPTPHRYEVSNLSRGRSPIKRDRVLTGVSNGE